MINIDIKIKVAKFFLPAWLQKEPYEQVYNIDDHKMHVTWLIKKHLIILRMDNKELLCTVEQPNGNAVTWYKEANWFGFYFAHKQFLNFLDALKLSK
jgi:hypothetical protein